MPTLSADNPLADLVPNNQAPAGLSADNPLADLVPKSTPSMGSQLMSAVSKPGAWAAALGALNQSPQNALDRVTNSGGTDFVAGGVDSITNQLRNVANLAPGVNIPQNAPSGSGFAYGAGHVAGDIGGFMAGGVGLDAARGAAEAAPLVGDAAQWLGGSGLGQTMARLGSGGALYGGIMSPDSRVSGAALGALYGGVGGAASKGLQALAPANWSTGATLIPGKLQENLDAAKGTETNLGAILGSPNLAHFYENILGSIPLGGVSGQMSRTAQAITDKAQGILDNYRGGTPPSQVESTLADALRQAYKSQKDLKSNLYKIPEATADQVGFSLNNKGLLNTLNQYKGSFENMPSPLKNGQLSSKPASVGNDSAVSSAPSIADLTGGQPKTPPLSVDDINALAGNNFAAGGVPASSANNTATPSVLDQYQKVINNIGLDPISKNNLQKAVTGPKDIMSALTGNTNPNISLKQANTLAGSLNRLSNSYASSPDPINQVYKAFTGQLGSALKDDIRGSIEKTGSDDLINQFKTAEQNYGKSYSPYLDKDVFKAVTDTKNPGTVAEKLLSTFIKTDRNTDQASQLNKLMDKLPPDAQNLVKYSFLSRANVGSDSNRVVDPKALATLWTNDSLGPNQKAALMSDPAERAALDKLSTQVQLNSNSFPKMQMFNPATGARLQTAVPYAAGLTASKILGPIAGIGTAGGAIGVARGMSKALTSEAVRNYLVGKMMNGVPTPQTGLGTLGGIGLSQALANRMRN